MSIEALRRSVLRPYRFDTTIKNKVEVQPIKLYIGPLKIVAAVVLPGGRWLVTLSFKREREDDDESCISTLHVWNLNNTVPNSVAELSVSGKGRYFLNQIDDEGIVWILIWGKRWVHDGVNPR